MRVEKRVMSDFESNIHKKWNSMEFVDIHCHCLPGLDDGPETMSEAILLCRMLADEGIAISVATPHQLGRYEGCNNANDVREAVFNLNNVLKKHNIPVNIVPGGEVRVDERVCKLLEADKVSTIADAGKYILLELPHEIFIDIEPLLKELFSMDIKAIISHVERHPSLIKRQDVLRRWLKYSACLQITSSSFFGIFGYEVQEAAWDYLKNGLVGIVATDSHDSNIRRPYMKSVYHLIKKEMGNNIAYSICIENPRKILDGMDIIPASIFAREEISH